MGDTAIEWTDSSWVMIAGCDHVSEGCGLPRWDGDMPGGCYAAKLTSGRLKHRPEYQGLAVGGRFTGEVRLLEHRLEQPLHWRKPRKIFVSDMADLFHKDVPDEFIARVFAVMAACPEHTFQVLTKRHARLHSLLSRGELGTEGFPDMVEEAMAEFTHASLDQWPLPNVWIGVSVESQKWADIRIPALLDTPAAVHWISAEPLLGPVDLRLLDEVDGCTCGGYADIHEAHCGLEPGPHFGIRWVVGGGESGPGARPMHPDWARSLRDQCRVAGTAYFHKQNGAYALVADRPAWGDLWVSRDGSTRPWDSDGGHLRQGSGDFRNGDAALVRKVGKKAAGRLLDGRTWDDYPQPREVSR